mgnify:CR=1 FL=1
MMSIKNLVWTEWDEYMGKMYFKCDNGVQYEVKLNLLTEEDYNGLKNEFDYIYNEDVFDRIFELAKPMEFED